MNHQDGFIKKNRPLLKRRPDKLNKTEGENILNPGGKFTIKIKINTII
jgi:hypothetical protein